MKFLHSMIRVKNIDEAKRFYRDLLGLVETRSIRLEDCVLYYLLDEVTGTEIELTYNDEIPSDGYEVGSAFGHFAFETDDMNTFAKKVQDMGYKWLYEPFYMEEVDTYIAFLNDPDGNSVEVIAK